MFKIFKKLKMGSLINKKGFIKSVALILCLSIIFIPAFTKINQSEAQVVSGSVVAGLTAAELYFLLCATTVFFSAICLQDKNFRQAIDMAVDDFVSNTQWAYEKAKGLIESVVSSNPQICPIESAIDLGINFSAPFPYTTNFPPPAFPTSEIDTGQISQLARNVFNTPVMLAIATVLSSFLAENGLNINATTQISFVQAVIIEAKLSELIKNEQFRNELFAMITAVNATLSSATTGDLATSISYILEKANRCLSDPNFWKSLLAGAGTLNMYVMFILAGSLALDDPKMFKDKSITITNGSIFAGVSAIPFVMDFYHWKTKGMNPRFINGPAHIRQAFDCLNNTGTMERINRATAISIRQGFGDLILSLTGEGIWAYFKFSETAQEELRKSSE